MEQSLFVELIHRTKSTLESIRKVTQSSRGKFLEKGFEDFFYQTIMGNIEKNDMLLNCFLNYIELTTPIIKKGTVNMLIEQVLKKYQERLEERQIRILKRFGEDLPETLVPNGQLRFILDSVLQYALASISPYGSIEFLTRSFVIQYEDSKDQTFFNKSNNIEILVTLECRAPATEKETVSNLILRLVGAIAERNQGKMEFESDETRTKQIISLKLPHERRKAIYYATN